MGLLQRGINANFRFLGAIESFATTFCRLARLAQLGDRWRKRQPSNMLLKKERDSLVEIGCGIAPCDWLDAVIPCRLIVVRRHYGLRVDHFQQRRHRTNAAEQTIDCHGTQYYSAAY